MPDVPDPGRKPPSTNRSKSSRSSECSSHYVHKRPRIGNVWYRFLRKHCKSSPYWLRSYLIHAFTPPHLSDGRRVSPAFRSMGFQSMFAVPRDFDRYSDRNRKSEALFALPSTSRPRETSRSPTSPLHAAPLDNRYTHHTIERGSPGGSTPKCPETLSRPFDQTRKMCHHG